MMPKHTMMEYRSEQKCDGVTVVTVQNRIYIYGI